MTCVMKNCKGKKMKSEAMIVIGAHVVPENSHWVILRIYNERNDKLLCFNKITNSSFPIASLSLMKIF